MADPILAILESPTAEQRTAALFNIPLICRLLYNSTIESHGGVTAAGYFAPKNAPDWYNALTIIPEAAATDFSSSTTSNTLVANKLFMLPAHGPLSVARLSGNLTVGIVSGGGGWTVYLEKVEFLLVKISSGGTETTLSTQTVSGLSFNTAATTYTKQAFGFSFTISPAASTGAGERFGIRVKTYGKVNNAAGVVHHSINADGGAAGGPTISGNNPSWFCLFTE